MYSSNSNSFLKQLIVMEHCQERRQTRQTFNLISKTVSEKKIEF